MTAVVLWSLAFVCALVASEPSFVSVRLRHGIALDVPKTWVGFPKAVQDQIRTAADAAVDLSGIAPEPTMTQLLDIRQPLPNTYARIIVSIAFGERLSPAELRALSARDIREYDAATKQNLTKVSAQMGLEVVSWETTTVEERNGAPCFRLAYTRTSPTAGKTTFVEMLQFHDTTRSITFSTEYSIQERTLWQPVAKRVAQSVRIHP